MTSEQDARTITAAPPSARASLTVGVVGTLLALAHTLGLLGALDHLTFVIFGSGAVVATVVGIRRYQPPVRWPLLAILAALLLFLVGGAARVGFGTLGDLSVHRSLVPDLFTMPGYVLLGAGLTGVVRARGGGNGVEVDAILDGVVAALAALTGAWVFLMNPVLFHEHAPLQVRILLAAYPPLSVFLVAVAARMAFGAGRRATPALRLVFAALGFMLLGDVVYMVVDARLAHLPESLVDLPYALAYVAFVCVALHPSVPQLFEPGYDGSQPTTRPRLAVVAGALAVPAVVTVVRQDSGPGDRLALSLIILALTVTAIWRVLRALQAHARAEARLAHRATHDQLTELPNRALAEEEVARCLQAARARGEGVGLVFLDVDHFKLVNDTHGHSLGDELLIAVAERLVRTVRPGDLVARIGGDEFIVVLEALGGVEDAVEVAERIRRSFHDPIQVRDSEIFSSISLGVAFAQGGEVTVDAEGLIRDADTAMYQAKAAGRDAVALFDASMRSRAAERLALEGELRHALARNQFELVYQPIVHFPGGAPDGVEALLRWTHPTFGEVRPSKFVPIAEDTGLVVDIGAWVIEEACRQVAAWREGVPGARDLHVAVNLSPRQLRDPALIDTVRCALDANALPPEALYLELTESLLMENPTAAAELLGELRTLGVGLSIDDFGTGYSSLAYLKRFPVDRVKIDRAFIEGLARHDTSEESLVAAIIAMAGALGMSTIAEGVEHPEQEQRLAMLGCALAQGHLYSRPAVAARVPEMLEHLGMAADSICVSQSASVPGW